MPILSELDSRGYAIRNGPGGQRKALLEPTSATRPGTEARRNFMKTIVTDNPRTARLGLRFVF
jgi:hypothetical protein